MKKVNKAVWIVITLVLVIIIGAFAFWKFVYTPRESYDALMSEAQSFADAGSYGEALSRVEEALDGKTDSENALSLKAFLCDELMDLESALATYQELYEKTGNADYESKIDEINNEINIAAQQQQLANEHQDEYNIMTGLWDSSGLYTLEFRPYDRYLKYTSTINGEIEFNGDAVLTRGETTNGRTMYTVTDRDATQSFQVSFDPKSDDYLMMDGQVYKRIIEADE